MVDGILSTAHVLATHHHQRPSHQAYQEALSANNELPKAHDHPSQHPRVFQLRPTGWKPKRAAKRDRFQKRMHHYHDTNRTTHIGPPRTSHTSQQVFRTPWHPLAPTSNRSRISHSEPPQNSFCGHLRFAYLLPIIFGACLLQSLAWLLDMVSKGQPSLMFLQHQVVARWVAWDQSFLSQSFMTLPAMASWILADTIPTKNGRELMEK